MAELVEAFLPFQNGVGATESAGEVQVNALIFSMGPKAEELVDSLKLSDDDMKSYDAVVKKNYGFLRAESKQNLRESPFQFSKAARREKPGSFYR